VQKHSVREDDSSDKKPAGIQGGDFVNRRDPYGKDQIVLFVFFWAISRDRAETQYWEISRRN
jgi:hypothetical protein